MPALRFNHMELTLPAGALARDRDAIIAFYGEVFGFDAIDVPLFDTSGLLLRTDTETSQFLLPIWFDIQVNEYDKGTAPQKSWIYR